MLIESEALASFNSSLKLCLLIDSLDGHLDDAEVVVVVGGVAVTVFGLVGGGEAVVVIGVRGNIRTVALDFGGAVTIIVEGTQRDCVPLEEAATRGVVERSAAEEGEATSILRVVSESGFSGRNFLAPTFVVVVGAYLVVAASIFLLASHSFGAETVVDFRKSS